MKKKKKKGRKALTDHGSSVHTVITSEKCMVTPNFLSGLQNLWLIDLIFPQCIYSYTPRRNSSCISRQWSSLRLGESNSLFITPNIYCNIRRGFRRCFLSCYAEKEACYTKKVLKCALLFMKAFLKFSTGISQYVGFNRVDIPHPEISVPPTK